MDISTFLTLTEKVLGFFKSFFWKNKNIVYINSNVKNLNIESIRKLISPSNSKYINCQSEKRNSLKGYKRHFRKQKINLFQIIRNVRDASKITYCGFSSQMFSVFDGYVLGDTNNYDFIEIKNNNTYYLISEKRKNIQDKILLGDVKEEINLVIETSYQIDESKCLNNPTIKLDMQEPSKITNDYLNKVYSSVKNVLDACGNKK